MVDNSGDVTNNFRSAVISEPTLMPPRGPSGIGSDAVLHTPFAGNVRALPPALPPQVPLQTQTYGLMNNYMGGYGGVGYGNYGGYGYGGNSFLGGGFGGYGGAFGGGYGGAYNRFGANGMTSMDPEGRFIQLAEASTRPAFESIESLVMAIGNIASMLDSTFFALTSSFRAILGVAANFGRLRGVFAQFWQTFALFRSITWLYQKLLYWLRISKTDPSKQSLNTAFAEAVNESSAQLHGAPKIPNKNTSAWPVIAFLSFIFTAPYLIMKLLGNVKNTAQEQARNPMNWVKPIKTVVLFDFAARNATELSIQANAEILIAPKEIQNTMGLLNTGWVLATSDNVVSGLIPVNYIKTPQQMQQEQAMMQAQFSQVKTQEEAIHNKISNITTVESKPAQPELMNLSPSAFASPPTLSTSTFLSPPTMQQQQTMNLNEISDFDIAPQPMGTTEFLDNISTNMA